MHHLYFPFKWLISHFFPTISRLAAKIVDKVIRLVRGNKLEGGTVARWHLSLQSVFEIQISLLRYICDINITLYGEEDGVTDFTKYRHGLSSL